MYALKLILFAALWFAIVYVYNALLARHFQKIELPRAALYFFTVALIGVFGEVFLDTVYNFFVGNPLWHYKILPIHDAYTSYYAPVIWGIYGFHLYLFHSTLRKWSVTSTLYRTLIFSFEALLFEALLTLSARFLLGDFMYYYFPGDLWHVTSLQNLPFYFICGIVIFKTIERFKADAKFFSLMSASLLAVLVFFA